MKREIKFRAWDKENKCFWRNVYEAFKGNLEELSINLNGRLHIRNIAGMLDESTFPDRFELMQYTGLKDKNGKEIYEGDVVKVCRKDSFKPYISEVYYSICCFGTVWHNPLHRRYEFVPLDNWKNEVIGNIYENTELLEAHDV